VPDEGILEGAFKRTDGAWIFKAPSPWLVGAAPHYIVNDAQKAAIARRLRTNKATNVAVIVVALFVLGFMAARTPEFPLETAWYVLAPGLIVLAGLCRYLAIRPLVAGLPRSSDRITFSEQVRRGAVHMSLTRSVVLFALFAALALFQLLRIFSVDASGFHVRPTVEASAVIPLTILSAGFGVLAIGLAVKIVAKLKSHGAAE
jgi:hypothetical protein